MSLDFECPTLVTVSFHFSFDIIGQNTTPTFTMFTISPVPSLPNHLVKGSLVPWLDFLRIGSLK